jgi:hypothetical protein
MDALLYLFVFLLISISLTDIWTNGYIFTPLRNWVSRLNFGKLLICPECFSFWVGFFLSFIFDPLIGFPGMSHYFLSHVFSGTVTFLMARFLYGKGVL